MITPPFLVGVLWEKARLANTLICEILSGCPDEILPTVRERLHESAQVLQDLESLLRRYRTKDAETPMKDKAMNRYLVWHPYDGETEDDASEILADTPEGAARKWAQRDDADDDYRIVGGMTADVCVRDGKQVLTILVTGEMTAVYYARVYQ